MYGKLNQFNIGFKTYFQNQVTILQENWNVKIGLNVNHRISYNGYLGEHLKTIKDKEGFPEYVYLTHGPKGYGLTITESNKRRSFEENNGTGQKVPVSHEISEYKKSKEGTNKSKEGTFLRSIYTYDLDVREYNSLDGQIYIELIRNTILNSTSLFTSILMTNLFVSEHDSIGAIYDNNPYRITYISLGIRRTDYSQREIYVKKINRIIELKVPYRDGLMKGFKFFYEDRLNQCWEREYRLMISVQSSNNRSIANIMDFYLLHSLINLLDYQANPRKIDGSDYAYLNFLSLSVIFSGKFSYNWGTKFRIIFNLDFLIYGSGSGQFRFGPDIYLIR